MKHEEHRADGHEGNGELGDHRSAARSYDPFSSFAH
jgi:hypothetical protein